MPKPIIYQLLPRLWGNPVEHPAAGGSIAENGTGKFSGIDSVTLDYLKDLGVTHVWYTGILRHATRCHEAGCEASSADWVKGEAGSPYAITDYFDVNPYLAEDPGHRMEEFEALVARTHAAGLKVLIDFVPNHLARDYGRFAPAVKAGRDAHGHPVFGALDDPAVHWKADNDFFYYPGQALRLPRHVSPEPYQEFPAKASGNCFSAAPGENDWYDTIKLNYCDFPTPTWNKMLEVILFWASKGVDGFRCDMVELVPQAFCTWLIQRAKKQYPQLVFVAEVYQKNLYDSYIHECGFDWLYDKSGLYDALWDIVHKNVDDSGVPIEQWQSTRRITWNWQFLGDLQPRMLNFLENHDEPRFASDFFGKRAENALAALHVSLLLNTAPFMLYFGQEIGERGMDEEGMSGRDGRTSIFDWWSPASLRRLYRHIHGVPSLLPEEERLLGQYRSLLRQANEDPAFSLGTTYDLCYCNLSADGFNQDRHFVFLRNAGMQVRLVACNFSDRDADLAVTIPQHAFEWMQLPQLPQLNPSVPIHVHVPAMNGIIVALLGINDQ